MCARVLVWVGFLAAELFVGYKLIIDLWFWWWCFGCLLDMVLKVVMVINGGVHVDFSLFKF